MRGFQRFVPFGWLKVSGTMVLVQLGLLCVLAAAVYQLRKTNKRLEREVLTGSIEAQSNSFLLSNKLEQWQKQTDALLMKQKSLEYELQTAAGLAQRALERPKRLARGKTPEFANNHPGPIPLPLDSNMLASIDSQSRETDQWLADMDERTNRLADLLDNSRSLLEALPNQWPLKGPHTSSFGPRDLLYLGPKHHQGVDIGAHFGSVVAAPSSGIVVSPPDSWMRGYGRYIDVDHGHGVKTRYAHLSKVLVQAGQRVTRGEPIGKVGMTGQSTGPHLHYEVRYFGRPINPYRFVNH